MNIHDNFSCSISLLNAKHFSGKGDEGRGYDGPLMKLEKPTYFIIPFFRLGLSLRRQTCVFKVAPKGS